MRKVENLNYESFSGEVLIKLRRFTLRTYLHFAYKLPIIRYPEISQTHNRTDRSKGVRYNQSSNKYECVCAYLIVDNNSERVTSVTTRFKRHKYDRSK